VIIYYTDDISVGDPTDSNNLTTCTGTSPLSTTPACENKITKLEVKTLFTSEIAKGTLIKFRFGPIKNPTVATSNSLTLEIYTDGQFNYWIDKITQGLIPSLTCNYPCKTCATDDKNKCITCFTEVASVPEKYFFTPNN
jgi:hypothetical protein